MPQSALLQGLSIAEQGTESGMCIILSNSQVCVDYGELTLISRNEATLYALLYKAIP